MLNGDGNEDGSKINYTCSPLFCTFLCLCFGRLQCRFARLEEELPYVLTKLLLLVFLVACIFFTTAHFHPAGLSLLTASISHILTAAMKFSCFFFPTKFVSFFLITRCSSLSVIHVSVNIEKYVEKDSTLLFFFLSKSPGNHAISRQKHLELPVVLYLLIELFYIDFPVVWTDGLSGVRSCDY